MKYELTLEQLYEIAECIAINELTEDAARNYIRTVAAEMNNINEVES